MIRELKKELTIPVIVAPMFLVSGKDLVIASCKEGLVGSFPFPNARSISQLEDWIEEIEEVLNREKALTGKKKIAPWAGNLIVHRSYNRLDDELKLIEKYKPKIVITSLGSPTRVVKAVHNYGGYVFADVNNTKFAKKAASTGVDGLILVSAGAGGHTGMMSPFAFIDEVRKFWKGSIVLAGSISTGQAVKASQILGADLAYMGTRFIPSKESMANEDYKQMLLDSDYEELILTAAITGVPAHFLKKSLINSGIDLQAVPKNAGVDFKDMSNNNNKKAWRDIWSAGHGIGAVEKKQTVKEIVEQLVKEYNSV